MDLRAIQAWIRPSCALYWTSTESRRPLMPRPCDSIDTAAIDVLDVVDVAAARRPARARSSCASKAAGINPGEAAIRDGRAARALAGDLPVRPGQRPRRRRRRGRRRRRRRVASATRSSASPHDRASHAELVVVDAAAPHAAARRGAVGGGRLALRRRHDRRGPPSARCRLAEGDVVVDLGRRRRRRDARRAARAPRRRDRHRAGQRGPPRLAARARRDPGDLRRRRRRAHPRGRRRPPRRVHRHLRLRLRRSRDRARRRARADRHDHPARGPDGIHVEGDAQGATAEVLAELAALIAEGELEVPIAASTRSTAVREAYTELERRHTLGKIVLVP